jgi:hypothetical protein
MTEETYDYITGDTTTTTMASTPAKTLTFNNA